ncbi:MAG TPA: TMEM175 family protein, partial [Verrucomicrobiae bacterium]|nr:TMEM175 family protein [Verrucomicrobiae bacterium]
LVYFSDAVFAIAITLLSLDIRLPTEHDGLTNHELFEGLIAIWPKYLGYIISFLVIGLFWKGHLGKFRLIKRYDNTLILLNLLFLMVIAFTPFSTRLLAEFGNRIATICYALTMVMASIFSALLWWYASGKNRMVDAGLNPQERRHRLLSPLAMAAVFLFSIVLAFINDDLARLSWLFLIPAAIYIR